MVCDLTWLTVYPIAEWVVASYLEHQSYSLVILDISYSVIPVAWFKSICFRTEWKYPSQSDLLTKWENITVTAKPLLLATRRRRLPPGGIPLWWPSLAFCGLCSSWHRTFTWCLRTWWWWVWWSCWWSRTMPPCFGTSRGCCSDGSSRLLRHGWPALATKVSPAKWKLFVFGVHANFSFYFDGLAQDCSKCSDKVLE